MHSNPYMTQLVISHNDYISSDPLSLYSLQRAQNICHFDLFCTMGGGYCYTDDPYKQEYYLGKLLSVVRRLVSMSRHMTLSNQLICDTFIDDLERTITSYRFLPKDFNLMLWLAKNAVHSYRLKKFNIAEDFVGQIVEIIQHYIKLNDTTIAYIAETDVRPCEISQVFWVDTSHFEKGEALNRFIYALEGYGLNIIAKEPIKGHVQRMGILGVSQVMLQ